VFSGRLLYLFYVSAENLQWAGRRAPVNLNSAKAIPCPPVSYACGASFYVQDQQFTELSLQVEVELFLASLRPKF